MTHSMPKDVHDQLDEAAAVQEQWPNTMALLDAKILAEQHRAEQLCIAELEAAAPLAVTPCAHHDMVVRAMYSSPFDDHSLAKGWCPMCGWIVVTEFVNGRSEARPMTPAEIEGFAAYEQRYAEAEWCLDFQDGER